MEGGARGHFNAIPLTIPFPWSVDFPARTILQFMPRKDTWQDSFIIPMWRLVTKEIPTESAKLEPQQHYI